MKVNKKIVEQVDKKMQLEIQKKISEVAENKCVVVEKKIMTSILLNLKEQASKICRIFQYMQNEIDIYEGKLKKKGKDKILTNTKHLDKFDRSLKYIFNELEDAMGDVQESRDTLDDLKKIVPEKPKLAQ